MDPPLLFFIRVFDLNMDCRLSFRIAFRASYRVTERRNAVFAPGAGIEIVQGENSDWGGAFGARGVDMDAWTAKEECEVDRALKGFMLDWDSVKTSAERGGLTRL